MSNDNPTSLNVFMIVWIIPFIWNHNTQKFTSETSPYFDMDILYEHSFEYELSLAILTQ
jgi:hypothetical protein